MLLISSISTIQVISKLLTAIEGNATATDLLNTWGIKVDNKIAKLKGRKINPEVKAVGLIHLYKLKFLTFQMSKHDRVFLSLLLSQLPKNWSFSVSLLRRRLQGDCRPERRLGQSRHHQEGSVSQADQKLGAHLSGVVRGGR